MKSKMKFTWLGVNFELPSECLRTTSYWGEKLENNNTAIPQGKTYEMTFGYVAPSGLTPAVNLNNVQAIAVIFETDNSGKPLRVLNSNRI